MKSEQCEECVVTEEQVPAVKRTYVPGKRRRDERNATTWRVIDPDSWDNIVQAYEDGQYT